MKMPLEVIEDCRVLHGVGGVWFWQRRWRCRRARRPRLAAPSIAAVIKGLDNPFFQTMESGVQDAATANDVKVEVQAATSITDTTGQADKLDALADQDYSCFIVNPITGTNLIQGIAQLSPPRTRRSSTSTARSTPTPPSRPTRRSPPTSAPTTCGRQAWPARRWSSCCPGGGKVARIGGISGDVTSAARIDGFTGGASTAQPRPRCPDRRRQLGPPEGPDPGHHIAAGQPRPGRLLRRQRRHGARRGPGRRRRRQDRDSEDHQRRRHQGRARRPSRPATCPPWSPSTRTRSVRWASRPARPPRRKDLPANVTAPVELVTKDNADKAIAATPKPFESYDDPFDRRSSNEHATTTDSGAGPSSRRPAAPRRSGVERPRRSGPSGPPCRPRPAAIVFQSAELRLPDRRGTSSRCWSRPRS